MNYVLKTGHAGAERLESVHALYGEESCYLLKAIGIKPNLRILDAGCGTGQMSAWMSNKVGSNGAIIAVDNSMEQLALANEKLKSLNTNNVTFICKNIEDLTVEDVGKIDIFYARLVLVHTKSPIDLIKRIKRICNKNTIIAFEEPITDTSFCQPESTAFNLHLKLYQQLGQISKLDFNIGEKLIGIMLRAGIQLQGIRKVQRAFNSETAKLIAYRRTLECSDKYLKYNLINKSDLDTLLFELKKLAIENYFISGVQMTQVWGNFT